MTAPLPAAAVCRRLLDALDAEGVAYCHWKSTMHLERALTGAADLDLLVESRHRARFNAIAARLRFVAAVHTGPKRIAGLEDHLGLDEATGALIHLHVHYRLILGEQRVKNHHLPIERWLLRRARRRDPIVVPRADDELMLLYIRAILKTDLRACLRAWRRGSSPFPASIDTELRWLLDQTTDIDAVRACHDAGLGMLAPGLAGFLDRLRRRCVTPRYVLSEKRRLLRQLRPYRRYSGAVCLARSLWFAVRYSRMARRVSALPKKRLPGRGYGIAITGADGSGKSTLTGDLATWLGAKLAGGAMYFGQPKGDRVLPTLRRIRKLAARHAAGPGRGSGRRGAAALHRIGALANAVLWIYVARHRARFDAALRARVARGEIVFAERFPLPAFWRMAEPMDGPRLTSQLEDRGLVGTLARYERRLYRSLRPPEGVIVLSAPLETLRSRKPETPAAEHRAKAEAITALASSSPDWVIDADRPYADVLRDAKQRVWSTMCPAATTPPAWTAFPDAVVIAAAAEHV